MQQLTESHHSRSSSPLSQIQSSRSPSPDPPMCHRSSGVAPCQPSGFFQSDRQSLSSMAPVDSHWKYSPSFGVVHSIGCDICTQFINHMIDAECSEDFQVAVMERDNHHDRHFCDGMSEGRRKQKQDFKDEVQFLRAESRHAEAALVRSLEENFALGRELAALKLSLETPALMKAQTSGFMLPGQSSTSIGSSDLSSPSSECQPAHNSLSYAAAVSVKVASTSDSMLIQYPGHQHTGSVTLSTHALPPRPSGPFPNSPSTTPHAVIAQAPSPSRNNHFPKNLQDLEWLMRAAHRPGNDLYLARVKALCAEAHATPRENKTELQEALLSKWRNPVTSGKAQSLKPDVKTNPRIDDSVEIWYSYLCTHQKSWPRGVRKDSLGRPFMSDLKASRIISRLRPEAGLDSSSPNSLVPRAAFMQQVVSLFSRPGTYQQILVRDDISVARSLSYIPFHEPTGPLTIESIARHCAACGITVEMATQDFEPWAHNYYLETSLPTPQPGSPL